jgi:hypothetical protein
MAELQRQHFSSQARLSGGQGPSVSLTSYGDRIRTVHLTLESIAAGELTPARTILWVSDEALRKKLPHNLKRLMKRGLEVRFTDDLGPHKKYFPYVMQERLERPLVTADDDILYPRWWLSGLARAHAKRPQDVHAYRVHVAKLDAAGTHFRPYEEWATCTDTSPRRGHFSTGCSGVLFPPEVLTALRAAGRGFDGCCPWADDVWLNLHAQRARSFVAQVRAQSLRFSGILLTQKRGLFQRNIYGRGNDAALTATFTASDIAALAACEDRDSVQRESA